jgi:DNA-binding NtrC family response regulator
VESAVQATANGPLEMPSLLEIGRRAAMQAEREAIERVLAQTRWNRRQAAKILRVSYKALLNKLKAIEEQGKAAKIASEESKVNPRQQPA